MTRSSLPGCREGGVLCDTQPPKKNFDYGLDACVRWMTWGAVTVLACAPLIACAARATSLADF